MGRECFLPTVAEDTQSSVVSEGATDDTQGVPSSSIWHITLEEAEFILANKPNGTFLVSKLKGKRVSDPSSSSINTHDVSVV